MNSSVQRSTSKALVSRNLAFGSATFRRALVVGLIHAVAISSIGALNLQAQEETFPEGSSITLTTEGISGYTDKKDRDPTLSVRIVSLPSSSEGGERVKLLAYAEVASHEYKEYPIRFDFFVNQRLLSSQIRSVELDGPVGVDVTPEDATQPFNYTVVATMLHPNRQFTTVLNGASFASDLVQTLDCTLTVAADSEEVGSLYQANKTESAQKGNDTILLSFEALSEDEETEADVSATVTLASIPTGESDETIDASAEATISIDGVDETSTLEGSVAIEAGAISSVTLASEDETTTLDCSASF